MSKVSQADMLNGMINSPNNTPKRFDDQGAFAGIETNVTKPAAEKVPAETTKEPRKNQKQQPTKNNLKRITFWGDANQWGWIDDYAYTTRQSLRDVMYTVIEDFQYAHANEPLSHRPPKRTGK